MIYAHTKSGIETLSFRNDTSIQSTTVPSSDTGSA